MNKIILKIVLLGVIISINNYTFAQSNTAVADAIKKYHDNKQKNISMHGSNKLTATIGYANQNLNVDDKNTMISIGYSMFLPFYSPIKLSVDYGFETPK